MVILGLQKDSRIKEQIVKIDEHTAKRYKVVEEVIDLDQLRKEKEALEAQLAEKEPSEEELVEVGRSVHYYYQRNVESIQNRIDTINALIKE